MRYRILGLAGLFLAVSGGARASTPASWANLDMRVVRACIAMSNLATPEVLATKVRTSDPVGVEVRLVRGYDRQRKFHRMICVFRRSNSRTEVHDIGNWNGPVVKP